MSSFMSDLSPTISSLMIDHWRKTPLWRKLAYINELNEALKVIAASDLRRRYPIESEAQLQRRLAARWLGDELADQVYGPNLEDADAAD